MTPWNKGKRLVKTCYACRCNFSGRGKKYCNLSCSGIAQRGKTVSQDTKRKQKEAKLGTKQSAEVIKKRISHQLGEKNWRWISDRTEVVGRHNRSLHDPDYKRWRMGVYMRDNFKCRIPSQECKGRIEAHHILTWKDFPDLRYEVNNGITLCHAHHPRRRAEEKRLVTQFQSLVAVSEALISQR